MRDHGVTSTRPGKGKLRALWFSFGRGKGLRNAAVMIALAMGADLSHWTYNTLTHNSERPFDVPAAGTTLRAGGTEFFVGVRPEHHVDVRVKEGRVQLTSSAQADVKAPFSLDAALLSAGDVAVSDPHGISVASQGWLTFSGETVTEAVEQVNRFGGVRFEIADALIAQKRIGGPVRIFEPDNFVLLLQAQHITSKAAGRSPDGLPRFLLRASGTSQPDEPM